MYYFLPDYYEKFHCTAQSCRDNCCIGWEIMIDDNSWELYRQLPGAIGEKLRRCVCDDPNDRHFILQENGRCPFLNEENRCEIILHIGEEALCDICDEHPRFSIECEGWQETGLGLCCEEAARLILSPAEAAGFLCSQTPSTSPEPPLPEALQKLLDRRWKLFTLLQNRDYPLPTRLQALLLAEEAGKPMDAAALSAALSFLSLQEYLSPEWPALLSAGSQFLSLPPEEQAHRRQDFENALGKCMVEYEHLAVYFLFRYYLAAYFDHRPKEKVRLTAAAVSLIELLALADYTQTGTLPDFSRRLRIAQLFSKEVEYNEDAMEGFKELLNLED